MDRNTVTAGELAEVLEVHRSSVLRRAEKEQWAFEDGKNREKRFVVNGLPAGIRNRIVQREAGCMRGMVLPLRGDLDLAQARAMLEKWEAAPEWSRRRAEARGEIVDGFEGIGVRGEGLGKKKNLTKMKKEFVRRFNAGNDGLGIDEGVYLIIREISRASLDRWRALKRDMGLVGLLDSVPQRRSFGGMTEEMKAYVVKLKVEKIRRRPVRIYEYLVDRFGDGNPPRPPFVKGGSNPEGRGEVGVPSEATVRRFLKQWERENAEYVAFLRNPDKWRSDYQCAMGDASESALYFLHRLEFDNTPADVMCADGKRYTICGAIDVFSRKARVSVVPTSKAQAVAGLMRRVILDWGLFDVMIKDNGKDYASRHVDAVCGALRIEAPVLPKFSPELKPHIERFFRTLTESLFEELDGFCGHNVAQAQDLRAQKSFADRMFRKGEMVEIRMTAAELQERIDAWIENIYHQREHSGLKMSPERKAGESCQPVRRIMDERVLDLLLAPAGTSTVYKTGIRYDNGLYVAVELADWVGQEVQRRRDIGDAGVLYVFSPAPESKFVCKARDAALEGLSVEEVNVARARQKKRVQEEARALKALAKDVRDPMGELIASRAEAAGRVVSFRREVAWESSEVEEARKALIEPEEKEYFSQSAQSPPRSEKVVPLREAEDVIFESKLERYKWLSNQGNVRELTEREIGFCEGYEGTEEYYQIFVMPYEGG